MEINNNRLTASTNKVLKCKIDNIIYSNEITMGKTFYRNGTYVPEGIQTTANDYEEIWGFDFENTFVTSDAKTYEQLTTDLIRVKYSLDAELALLANIRTDANKYKQEEADFQTWRTKCKQKAKELFNIN